MSRAQRRLIISVFVGLPLLLFGGAWLYQLGMTHLEGDPRSFLESIQWSGETLTTTGYGDDGRWQHPLMVVLTIAAQFIGVFMVFLVIPIYLIPFLEERFEARLPRAVPSRSGHVVVYSYGPAVTSLLEQLKEDRVRTLVVEHREVEARRLIERRQEVVVGTVEEGVLEAAHLNSARALVVNGSDAENAAVTLAARQGGYTGDIIALVEEPFHRRPMRLAGADAIFTPRHMLGAVLGARASHRLSPPVAGVQQIGRKLEVQQLKVARDSPLVGATLKEAGIGRRTGATVIGQWVGGKLIVPPAATMRIEPRGIVVAVGSAAALERLEELTGGDSLGRGGPIVVAGFGEVGQKVVGLLSDVEEEVLVIDRIQKEGVDVVGDVLDPTLLERMKLNQARSVVLALDNDSSTLFATVILKEVAPDVPVIARVNDAANVERIHHAGADFALSISQVSAQILVRRLLGEEAVVIDPQLKVVKVSAGALSGKRAGELAIRRRTGCSVVAVERGEEALVEIGPDFRFEEGDAVYIAGSRAAVADYQEEFGR